MPSSAVRSVTIMAHARGDHGDFDAVGQQALQAESVVHVERLHLAAVVGVDQAAVGEHAVDIEDRELDARGAVADIGGEVGWEHGSKLVIRESGTRESGSLSSTGWRDVR